MKTTKTFTLIFLFFVTGFAKAQSWKQTGPVNFPGNLGGQINGIGRVTQLKFHPRLPGKLYATSASGGLFSSMDNGENWVSMNTDKFPQAACASVCIDYANDSIIYLSTGDPNHLSIDFGIYKTTNAGATWAPANTNIGNRMAVEMLMDPSDHTKLVAATNDGIWHTVNGGASWTNTKSGGLFQDMKQRPNSNTLYAVTKNQFWISNDFGITWNQVTTGLVIPANTTGLRLGVSAADNNIVYVLADGANGVLFKSANAGASFTKIYSSTVQCIICYDEDPASSSQGNYNLGMCADPFDATHVYVVAHCLWESNDGGLSFQKKTNWYTNLHTDHHGVEVNPYDATQLWNINDGGVWKRRGLNDSLWDAKSNGISATEIYTGSQSPAKNKMVYIGTQDNGELIYDGTWKTIRGGDWPAFTSFDYSDKDALYYMISGERRNFNPITGFAAFNSPLNSDDARISFHPKQLDMAIMGKYNIFLTTNLRTQAPTWAPVFSTTNAIRDLCISRADSTIAYIISDNAQFVRIEHLLGAPVVTSLTAPNSTTASASVATVKGNINVVYLSCSNRIFRSADKGTTWTDITYNLPGTNIPRIYHDDLSTDETIYLYTGNKVYKKSAAETSWTNISYNLPSIAAITGFLFYNNSAADSKLRVTYYGRGVWEYNIHPNYPPLAAFSSDRTNVCAGQQIQFTDQSEGDSLTYNWTFQGGTPANSSLQSPLVTYSTAGIYNVSLTVSNAHGSNQKTVTSYIKIGSVSPQITTEGFEGTNYPPDAWTLEADGTAGINWYRVDSVGGFGKSRHSIAFDNFSVNTIGRKDQIRLPLMNLTPFSSARLTFDVAYAPFSATAYLDSLLIGISTDCGRNFTYLYTKAGSSLATAPENTNTIFIPDSTQWRTDTISLNNYLNSDNVWIAFENRGHWGQQLFIDNINLQVGPKADFTVNDTTICNGNSVNFADKSTGLVNTWNWTFPGGTPASSTQQNNTVTYNTAGLYPVTLTVGNGSGNNTKNRTNYIRVYDNPVPVITTTNITSLSCNISGASYQWYLNNTAIAGATQQTWNALQNGLYAVTVTDPNGCSATSAAHSVNKIVETYDVQVYPNPSYSSFTVTSKYIKGNAILKLYNAAGALVLEKTVNEISDKNLIDIKSLAAGMYEIKLVTARGNFVKKITRITRQ